MNKIKDMKELVDRINDQGSLAVRVSGILLLILFAVILFGCGNIIVISVLGLIMFPIGFCTALAWVRMVVESHSDFDD